MSRGLLVLWALMALTVRAEDESDADEGQVTRSQTVTTRAEFPRIHLLANGFVDLAGLGETPRRLNVGFELGATYAPTAWLDLGLGANFGNSIGLMALVDAHLPWRPDSLVRAFIQLRGLAQFASAGYGGGAWAGVEVELGPGRLKAGPAGYVFAPSQGFVPYSVVVALGYELDLLRPATDTEVRTERVVVREKVVVAPPKALTVLKGRLVDLDDRPVNGVVRIKGKEYEASNSFELELPAGDYLVEAEAPGYLIRGRRLKVSEGETSSYDFVLRPVPRVKTAELTRSEVTIAQQIQFEFNQATILPNSFFILDEVVDVLIRNPQVRQVRVEGHTDDVGGQEFNQTLSENRSLAVVKYLVEHGVDATRLQAQGFGMTKPVASNKSEAGRAKNRRVQFRITQQ
ncbi:MAG: OmpA family protein [Myxococcaceae bacterium]|nr:OmpA family protein [Myxococcaceae bacterium]